MRYSAHQRTLLPSVSEVHQTCQVSGCCSIGQHAQPIMSPTDQDRSDVECWILHSRKHSPGQVGPLLHLPSLYWCAGG